MKNAIVLPAKGIGDALLMMIASQSLLLSGYHVTTFHPMLHELQSWFPGHSFSSHFHPDVSLISSADLIIIENDNSPWARNLILQRNLKTLPQLSVFYPTYFASKHGPLNELDQAFTSTSSMADNISFAIASLLKHPLSSKNNGLTPLSGLQHRKEKTRVLIHPTSTQEEKNWSFKKYIEIATALGKKGYAVVFCVGPSEYIKWQEKLQGRFPMPYLTSLADLAAYVYESGYLIGNDSLTGHLASNLNIPTLIISNSAERMKLWRPGWLKGEVLTPPSWIPNWKGCRLRETYWRTYISTSRALKTFDKLRGSF